MDNCFNELVYCQTTVESQQHGSDINDFTNAYANLSLIDSQPSA